ncbi:MAG: hypothetical protein JO020_32330 [Chloroflexi bacterium]|nr:hypothetical protein [Chloroflexota bacterium]MBV9135309.1 hypothetical protein [Chloroflexota bacterium]MBV9898867.1 hypothetical protein [Chloroflexota bacterium]
MVVPAYCRTASGRVFRLLRSSELIAPDRIRFVLRAQSIDATESHELACELDTEFIRDKIANRQAIPTPETTFEDLWSKLKSELGAQDGG